MALPTAQQAMAARLTALAQACQPQHEDYTRRMQVLDGVQMALQGMPGIVNGRVQAYGSFISGFYNSASDLDLAFSGYRDTSTLPPQVRRELFRDRAEEQHVALCDLDKSSKTKLLKDIAKKLVNARIAAYRDINPILGARVPILKFVDSRHFVDTDLCLGGDGTPFKAWFVQQVSKMSPAFCDLFRVVKLWAKAHDINDGSAATLNSWCLTLTVMFYLQEQHGLVPPLYQLMYGEEPPADMPRLLQGGQPLDPAAYEVVQQRVEAAAAHYRSLPAPDLCTLFAGYVGMMDGLFKGLLSGDRAKRGLRLSPYYGRYEPGAKFAKAYVLLVEDPFDSTDNTARTLGAMDGSGAGNSVYYVAHVFDRSARRLQALLQGPPGGGSSAASTEELALTLAYLFGPAVVSRPSVGLGLFPQEITAWVAQQAAQRVPATAVHRELLAHLDRSPGQPVAAEVLTLKDWAKSKAAAEARAQTQAALAGRSVEELVAEKQERERKKRADKAARKAEAAVAEKQAGQEQAGASGSLAEQPQSQPQAGNRPARPASAARASGGPAASASSSSSAAAASATPAAIASSSSGGGAAAAKPGSAAGGPRFVEVKRAALTKRPDPPQAQQQQQHQQPQHQAGEVVAVTQEMEGMGLGGRGKKPPRSTKPPQQQQQQQHPQHADASASGGGVEAASAEAGGDQGGAQDGGAREGRPRGARAPRQPRSRSRSGQNSGGGGAPGGAAVE